MQPVGSSAESGRAVTTTVFWKGTGNVFHHPPTGALLPHRSPALYLICCIDSFINKKFDNKRTD